MANKTTKTDINNAILNSMDEMNFLGYEKGFSRYTVGKYMGFLSKRAAEKEKEGQRPSWKSPTNRRPMSPDQAKNILADIKKNAPEFYAKFHPERWLDYDPRTGVGGKTVAAEKFYGEKVKIGEQQFSSRGFGDLNWKKGDPIMREVGGPIMGGMGMAEGVPEWRREEYPGGWKYTGQEFLDETLLEPDGTSYDVTPEEKAEIYKSGEKDLKTRNKRYSVTSMGSVASSTAEDKIMNGFLQQDNKYKIGE